MVNCFFKLLNIETRIFYEGKKFIWLNLLQSYSGLMCKFKLPSYNKVPIRFVQVYLGFAFYSIEEVLPLLVTFTSDFKELTISRDFCVREINYVHVLNGLA